VELEKNRAVTTKLESENAEFRDRITKVEQRQMLNDNSSNNNSSNFNSVAKDRGKSLVDEEMDGSFHEKVCYQRYNLQMYST